MSKHSGENTLLQIFHNIKETVNGLKELINAKQQPYVVTATGDFENGVLTDVSKTMDEIQAAFGKGDHVILELDIGSLVPGMKASTSLTAISEYEAVFALTTCMGTEPVVFVLGIKGNGGSYLMTIPLVSGAS